MDLSPTLLSAAEIRAFFNPTLSHDDASDVYLNALIEGAEAEIRYIWNGGDAVSKEAWSEIACAYLVLHKLFENPKIAGTYLLKKQVKIGNYSYTMDTPSLRNRLSYEERAYRILRAYKGGIFNLKVLQV